MSEASAKSEESAAAPPGLRALAPVDALHLVVLLLLLVATPFAIRRGGAGWWLPTGYAVLGAAILALARAEAANPAGRLVRFLHFWYPLAAVPLIFWSFYWIVPGLTSGTYHDDLLIRWDRGLLGFDPIEWHRGLESPLLTDVMHIFYLSYFFLPVLLVTWLIRKRRTAALSETIFVLCLSFYLCYVGYLVLPAQGPRFAIYHSNEMKGLFLTQPLRDLIDSLEPSKADAFPSAHAAVTLVVAGLALKHAKELRTLMLVLTVGILASLVYARYHYVVDVLAGAAFAAVALLAGPPLAAAWERLRGGPA